DSRRLYVSRMRLTFPLRNSHHRGHHTKPPPQVLRGRYCYVFAVPALTARFWLAGERAFSTQLMTTSAITAIRAVGIAPARIMAAPSVTFVPRMMIDPRPPPPINAPI